MKDNAAFLKQKISITLAGAGNLAWNLVNHWKKFEQIEISYWNRNTKNSLDLSSVKNGNVLNFPEQIPQNTDFIFICTSDAAIEETAQKFQNLPGCLVHCSGSTGLDILKKYNPNCAVFYPLQTFSKSILSSFSNIPVLIEADGKNLDLLNSLATQMGALPSVISSEQRLSLHLAAVFACNFTNHLWAVTWEICKNNEIDFHWLQPLIQQTIDKAFAQNTSPSLRQTGPAKRNDLSVINKHLSLLRQNQINHDIYQLLSKAIAQNNKDEKL